jgi:Fe-S cluster assembly protein SufD
MNAPVFNLNGAHAPTEMQARRKAARQAFEAAPFPTSRDEEWRYTPLRQLWDKSYTALPSGDAAALLADFPLDETAARRIVFVNGRLDESLSDWSGVPHGVTVTSFADADASASALIESNLGRADSFGDDYFAQLSHAHYGDGILIHARKNMVSPAPIAVYSLVTDPLCVALPKVLYVGDVFSEMSVIEVFHGPDATDYLHVPFTEIVLADEARLHHFRVQQDGDTGVHINRTASVLGRSSDLQSFTISLGARLFRNDIRAALDGEGGHATLDGLVLVHGNQLSDTHSVLDHRKPNCTSHQLHKCIVDGQGTSVFNGKIFVRQIAQQTNAFQENHNLQLSHHGQVYTKPQLEIFADDVKCSHGATVGQMDDEQLFYLKSRGLTEVQTRYLLTFGFAAQIVNALPEGTLKERLTTEVDSFTRKSFDALTV